MLWIMYDFKRNRKNPFGQKLVHLMSQIHWPETDRMCYFLGPETNIMGER